MKKIATLIFIYCLFQATPSMSQSLNWDWVKLNQGKAIPTLGNLFIDVDSSIYASFSFQEYVTLDNLTLQFQQKNVIDTDLGVWKLDRNGNSIWAKRYGTNAVEHAGAIGRDLNGRLYATSDTRVFYTDPIDTLQPGFHRFYINEQGNWLEARKVSRVAHRDKRGRELIIGTLKDTLILGNDTLIPEPGIPIYPEKYIAMRDSNSHYYWAKKLGSSDSLRPKFLYFLGKNKIVLVGVNTRKSSTICGDTLSQSSVFWTFYDTLGNCSGLQNFPMSEPTVNRMLINAQSEIFIVGQYTSALMYNGKTWNQGIVSGPNLFLIKIDTLGHIGWVNASEGIISHGVEASAITKDLHGNIIIGGTTWGKSQLEQTILGQDSIRDLFIAAFSPESGKLLWTKESDTEKNQVGPALHNFYWANIYDIKVAPTNQLLVLGNFLTPTYTLGKHQLTAVERDNFYIAALNLNITKSVDSEMEEQCLVHLAYHNRGISITENCPENPVTHFALYAITGQEITLSAQERLSDRYYLGLSHSLSAGLYVLNWKRRDGSFGAQKFISLGE